MSELINKAKENVPKVYESGRKIGHDEGIEEGYDNGLSAAIDAQEAFLANKPQTYYDVFWDVLQNKGAPTRYYWRFAYNWNDDIYNPKYNIVGSNISNALGNLFYTSSITDTKVAIDATRVPNGLSNCFYWARALQRIRKLIITEATAFNASTFTDCKALISIDEIEGKIGQNGFDIHWSTKLNKASIESIINALSTTTEGLTVTLSQTAVDTAFTSEEWEALEATKSNWNISLVQGG